MLNSLRNTKSISETVEPLTLRKIIQDDPECRWTMTGFWEKRRKIKLYNQWIRQGELRPEDIPEELQPGKKKRDEGNPVVNMAQESDNGRDEKINGEVGFDNKTVFIPIRYVLYIGLLIVLLAVALAVVFTILILSSC